MGNGKMFNFIGAKVFRLHLQSKKPAKLRWTVDWRRKHKKAAVLKTTQRIKKKTTRVDRAIEGLLYAQLKQRQNESAAVRKEHQNKKMQKLKEARLKQQKERAKKKGQTAGNKKTNKGKQLKDKPQKGKGGKNKTKGARVRK